MTVVAPDPRPFDACGELPTGMTLLQASAGTGKTFTIAALTTRYVAEGILPIDRLLVITFTRMATGELRERVRERLVRAFDGLVDILAGQGGHRDDELVQLLARGPSDEVEARRDRLGKAIADFDAATIETTHGFCLQVLYGLGTAGDVDREVTLVEDVSDLMEEVVDDLFLRRFAHKPNALDFDRKEAMEIARAAALGHPDADMVPPLSQAEDLPSIRRRFAKAVREEMEDRKKARKILTYDDVLSRLRTTLFDEARGPAACARLRERYDVVLVDEFQDTDPVQWDIMHRAFGEGGATLVLIGDPKQAIYAFRGADVHAYLQARDEVQSEWTLDVNWRSDQALLEAYDALFGDAQLGYAGIAYRKVRAADANQRQRLVGCQVDVPLRVRMIHGDDGLVPLTEKRQQPKAPDARTFIARDLAAEVVQLLSDAPELITRSRGGAEVERTTVHPGHLAVLVRTNSQAVTVRDALRAAGVPAVIGGSGSVFATDPALEWLRLLQALERPTARDRASLAALTCFVGWTPEEVATADEAEWEGLHWSLHRWATLLREQGVASLYQAVSSSHEVPERVLARPSGERFMTDLRHIAQLLHEAGVVRGPRADGHGHLARPPDPRCGSGRRERGAGAAPRVGCRGGAGDHDPPQQGARVPDCVLPVHVGRPALRQRRPRPRAHVPRSGQRQPAHHRRRTGRQRLRPAPEDGARGGARRGSPAALRGTDPGAPPGSPVVGRDHRTASTHRWPGCCSTVTPRVWWAPTAPRPGPTPRSNRPSPGWVRASRSSGSVSRRPGAGRRATRSRRSWRRRSSTGPSTSAGAGRRTRASPAACTTSPWWGASRSSS